MFKELGAHGGNRRQIMARYGLGQLTDFSASLNPLGLPPQAEQLIRDNLALIGEYPAEWPCDLESKLAAHHGLDAKSVIVGNGSTELIYLLPHLLPKGRAVIVTPGFSEYRRACLAAQWQVIFWPARAEQGFVCDWDELLKQCGRQMDLLWLANPGNPTGGLIPKSELNYLIEKTKKYDFLLVVDEAFIEFSEEALAESLLKEAPCADRLLVLRSLTKFYAIPGLRLGYCVGNPELTAKLRGLRPPWSVNSLAQAVGQILPELRDYQEQTRSLVNAQRAWLYRALGGNPVLAPYPSAANYLLVRITGPGLSAEALQDKLIRRGYLIRNCANFRGLDESYFRIAVRTEAENRGLLAALEEVLHAEG